MKICFGIIVFVIAGWCCQDARPHNLMEIEILGIIDNDEITSFYKVEDIQQREDSFGADFSRSIRDRHFIDYLKFDYIAISIRNNSRYVCKCGLRNNGFLMTSAFVFADPLLRVPDRGGMNHPFMNRGDTITADTFAYISPGEIRYFLALAPQFSELDSSGYRFVGIRYDCEFDNLADEDEYRSINDSIPNYFVYRYK